jgi:hypothetical protein
MTHVADVWQMWGRKRWERDCIVHCIVLKGMHLVVGLSIVARPTGTLLESLDVVGCCSWLFKPACFLFNSSSKLWGGDLSPTATEQYAYSRYI